MNKILVIMLLVGLVACHNDEPKGYDIEQVSVQLTGDIAGTEGIVVKLTDNRGAEFSQATDAQGLATFRVPVGIYQASVSWVGEPVDGWRSIYNGSVSNLVVSAGQPLMVELPLTVATTSSIIIRELYVGGCQKDDGSGWFHRDKYVIVANNSGQRVTLPGLCLAICTPYNSYGINKNYTADGRLNYEDEGFIPAASAFWYFPGNEVVFEPWEQKVIALNGAIDHTLTYTNSVNLANAAYYCTYDIEQYSNTSYYPSPSEVIPTGHYLRVVRYGDESEQAWPLSNSSPAFFIFTPPAGMSALEFGNDAGNVWYDEGRALPTYACRKVPVGNILDGVEVYSTAWQEAAKRLTAAVDVGYVYMTSRQGHSVERRIDEAETARQGHTVYQDTNNSTADFVEREHASLHND